MASIIMELVRISKEKEAQLVKEVTESTARITGLPEQAIFVFLKDTAWLVKCIEAGRAADICFPGHELYTMTNFIR